MRQLIIILLLSNLFSMNTLSISSVSDDGEGNVTFTLGYSFDDGVYGFQFDFLSDGVFTLTEASGGILDNTDMSVSTDASGTVIGFSMTGASIPAGSGTFLLLSGTYDTANAGTAVNIGAYDSCNDDGNPACEVDDTRMVLSGASANALESEFIPSIWTVGSNTLDDVSIGVTLSYNNSGALLAFGEQFDVTISISNTMDIAGIQIVLQDTPESITMIGAEAGERLSDIGYISSSDFEGVATVLWYDLTGAILEPGSGEILTLTYEVNENASTSGSFEISTLDTPSGTVFSTLNGDEIPYTSNSITVYVDMIQGCTDTDACNYNLDAIVDDGSCAYEFDQCGVCDGDNTTCQDCAGVPNGYSWESDCGCVAAGNSGDDCDDCTGTPNGYSWESDCGCVAAGNSGDDCNDCAGTPNGDAEYDCAGQCNGDALLDNCDICDSDSSNDCTQDCYGIWGGLAVVDECEECTEGFTGLQYNYLMDECGVCEGQGISEGTCDCEENLDTCNVCPYLNPNGYGSCNNTLGWIPVGLNQCQLVTGCGFGLDEEWFFNTQEECLEGCENCRIINPSDYGDCAIPLGWGFDGNDCQYIEGCGYGDDEGWFYELYDDCMTRCAYNWDNLDNEIIEIPTTFTINAYPNPFNPSTNIHFQVPEYSNVVIQIFNLNGQIVSELFNGYKTPGAYTLKWSGENYTSGTYLLRMTSGSFIDTQKISLIK